jgi:hypothetical protein
VQRRVSSSRGVSEFGTSSENVQVDEDIRRAEQVVEAARRRFMSEGLPLFTCLHPFEYGCMVHVDFFDEEAGEEGDGLTFTVTSRNTCIEVLDPYDHHMQEPELLEYLIMRARGATPSQAIAAIEGARPKRPRWWQRPMLRRR